MKFAWIVLLSLIPTLAHSHQWELVYGPTPWIPNECCGDNDCFVVPNDLVTERSVGYVVSIPDQGTGWLVTEIVPYQEARRSMDGRYWRCKKPDGTRRCFFSPAPSM
jgi:hypothetical protein